MIMAAALNFVPNMCYHALGLLHTCAFVFEIYVLHDSPEGKKTEGGAAAGCLAGCENMAEGGEQYGGAIRHSIRQNTGTIPTQ